MSAYQDLRGRILPGDLTAWRGSGPVSGIIAAKIPNGAPDVTHVAGVVHGPPQCPRRIIVEAHDGEVNVRILSARLKDYSGSVWWYPLREEFAPFRDSISRAYWELLGVPYDYRGLLRNAVCYVDQDQRALFCSELVCIAITRIPIHAMQPVNAAVRLLHDGKALRPWDCCMLPVWGEAVRIK